MEELADICGQGALVGPAHNLFPKFRKPSGPLIEEVFEVCPCLNVLQRRGLFLLALAVLSDMEETSQLANPVVNLSPV